MTRGLLRIDLFRQQLNAFARAAQRIEGGDIEAVHQARVASRRLRELVPVLGLDDESAARLGRRLKKVTKWLGGVRELDVSVLTLEELGRDTRYSSTALTHLLAAVQDDRMAARQHLATKLPTQKLRRLERRLQRAAVHSESASDKHQPGDVRRPERAWVWAIEARAARRAVNVRSAIETAGIVYGPERLHDVRIAVKQLRYALELVAHARGKRRSPDLAVLKGAQDSLGELHDLEILVGRAHQDQATLAPPILTAWRELDSLIAALEQDCRTLHARYVRDRAKLIAVADRICATTGSTPSVKRRAVS